MAGKARDIEFHTSFAEFEEKALVSRDQLMELEGLVKILRWAPEQGTPVTDAVPTGNTVYSLNYMGRNGPVVRLYYRFSPRTTLLLGMENIEEPPERGGM